VGGYLGPLPPELIHSPRKSRTETTYTLHD